MRVCVVCDYGVLYGVICVEYDLCTMCGMCI